MKSRNDFSNDLVQIDSVLIFAISFESSKRSKDTETEGAAAAACLSQHTQPPLNVPKGVGNQGEAEKTYLNKIIPNLS